MSNKRQGWDNDEHRRNVKKGGEAYTQTSNVKEFKKQPYDPAKEVLVERVGSIAFKPGGPFLRVDVSTYDEKFDGVILQQEQDDRSKKFWKLRISQVEELAALLAQALRVLDNRERVAEQKRAVAREERFQQREHERRHEEVRKIVGRR